MTVFISHAWDDDGRAYAEWLVTSLRAEQLVVTWDGDLAGINPSSMQEWMEIESARGITICVVTKEYGERFGRGSDSPHRKGVLYESRIIEQRLHDHTLPDRCPIIPVAPGGQHIEQMPAPLRRLLVTSIFNDTGVGLDELLTRIRALGDNGNAMKETETRDSAKAEYPELDRVGGVVRSMVAKLESMAVGTPEAVDTVMEWLSLAEHGAQPSALFAQGFPDAEKVAKSTGDLQLMCRISDACLNATRSSSPRIRSDYEMEARVLICGSGWYLQRSHELQAALDATRRGIDLAAGLGDRRTEAFGSKCSGRLERLMAEDTNDVGVSRGHLERSISLLDTARAMFLGIDGADSEEAGDCLSLTGRAWLTHYRLTTVPGSLDEAKTAADMAAELIPPGNSKDYWDLVILQAELLAEDRQFSQAGRRLQDAIERLRTFSDAGRSEILARALAVRAAVVCKHHPRNGLRDALHDLDEAGSIYQRLGQVYAVASCAWSRALLDPSTITRLPIGREELEELARIEPNPRVRLDAVKALTNQEDARVGTTIGRRIKSINWTMVLRRVRIASAPHGE
jgi:hypothetical protein